MDINEKSASFAKRMFIYQKERFPLLGHGLLVASFSFSAVSFSRICRQKEGFIDWNTFFVGVFTTISLFFLVRVFDEFKDREEDAKFRKHLPVPRGLVTLKELAIVGLIAFIGQIILNAWYFPKMLMIYAVVFGYLCLMGKEFFIPEWLKKHQFWYVVSHMMIIPLIDVYASGLDWFLEGAEAPKGLLFFFVVSFMNGVVLEIGRKIKTLENEEFNTYSTALGAKKATFLWISVLTLAYGFMLSASVFAGFGWPGVWIGSSIYLICLVPGLIFISWPTAKSSKAIEYASALWTIGTYLSLGGIPMLLEFIASK